MIELINEIEQLVKNNNLRCALGMALTLPDICANIEFPNEKSNRKRYESWCQSYLFNQGYLPSHIVDKSKPFEEWEKKRVIQPDMCYKLRCAFLHSGNLELNQYDNDDFPVFNLKISSTEDDSIYIDNINFNERGEIKEITLDVRLLIKVICNASKEFYFAHEPKADFNNHNVNIIDIEQEVKTIQGMKSNYIKMQHSKTNIRSYDELTNEAKSILLMFQNDQQKELAERLKKDDNCMFSIFELLSGGFIRLSEGV